MVYVVPVYEKKPLKTEIAPPFAMQFHYFKIQYFIFIICSAPCWGDCNPTIVDYCKYIEMTISIFYHAKEIESYGQNSCYLMLVMLRFFLPNKLP